MASHRTPPEMAVTTTPARAGAGRPASLRRVPLTVAGPRPRDEHGLLGLPASDLTPQVQAALSRLVAEVEDLRRQLCRANLQIDRLKQLADRDALTPVLNRRAFMRELSRVMAFARRYGVSGSLLYLDVNGMKRINDAYGHNAGDATLSHVARLIAASVRETDVVGRLGGDEFGVILVQAQRPLAIEKARSLAAALRRDPPVFEGRRLSVQVAYGVHSFEPDEGVAEALDAADRAMYAQKMS